MSVAELCWICIGLSINTVTFFIGMAVGASTKVK
jgi:hypothetical protein